MLNVTCSRNALHEAVQTVSRGVTGRSTQPVQNDVYLEASESGLRLAATDLELISIEADIPVALAEAGSVTAPSRVLTEVAGSLPDGDVTLAADERNSLSITCGKSHYSIQGRSGADFQRFPAIDEGIHVSLPGSELNGIIRQTAFAASRDETRPILTGVLFEFENELMRVVATDTYRLALRNARVPLSMDTPFSVIVAARALGEVQRVVGPDHSAPVDVVVGANQIEFAAGNVKIASRLIEGQFPNYKKVVPESHERRVALSIGNLEPALRRALIVARDDAYRVVFHFAEDMLEIRAESQDVGRVEEQIPAEAAGTDMEIAFNARYMLEVLEAVNVDRVNVDLSGSLNPGMIRAEGNEEYLYVLMPMQIM